MFLFTDVSHLNLTNTCQYVTKRPLKNFSTFSQLPLVWLQTLWAATPPQPPRPVDLTTASLSQCPTCTQTRATKQVDIDPQTPSYLYLLSLSCHKSFLFTSVHPCVLSTLFVSYKSACRRGEQFSSSEAPASDSWDGRQVHHQHAQRHHASYTPHPGPARQER